MTDQPLAFDRQVDLVDMLRYVPRAALEAAMEQSVGPAWEIANVEGVVVREGPLAVDGDSCTLPLVVDIEVMGSLSAPAARQEWLAAAAKWIELLLGASNRYRMAADLHLETVHSDHRELMAKHAALTASETRYRNLNAELELRVRQQVELIEQSQRRMYQAEKMASVGNLAAGMAHEINNPIGFIRSNLNTATAYVKTMETAFATQTWPRADADKLAYLFEDFGSLLNESIAGADRVGSIIIDLKAYAASGLSLLAMANPNDAVKSALRMLGDLPDGVVIEQRIAQLPSFTCDIEGLHRVVLALLLNARTAMKGRTGVIRIASAAREGELLISVADEGCGIEEALLGRIFDPFYTTQDVGGGIGLGLTVANDVVRAHNGQISVGSTVGKGSTFLVRLPLAVDGGGEGGP